jgi:IS30 family transposase
MQHLTQKQRYEISTLLQLNMSKIAISRHLGVDKSTISRELKRNTNKLTGVYDGTSSEILCRERHKAKNKSIRFNLFIQLFINEKLKLLYSPEQISGYAKKEGIDCVSHERIYQYIWKDKKDKGLLYQSLRNYGRLYSKRGQTTNKRGQIPDRVDITERPLIVEERSRLGDLEMDLIIGKEHKKALLTINDRASGKLYMSLLDNKESVNVETETLKLVENYEGTLHTITTDNGKEFAKHKNIALALNIAYYFATPYHSWERGSNENLNGLVRQFFPKGISFEDIKQADIDYAVDNLNNRPRKRHGYKTPNEIHKEMFLKEQMSKAPC